MNAFKNMASSLTAVNPSPWSSTEKQVKPVSRTETIRQLLKAVGRPMTAEEVVWDVDFPNFGTDSVWFLMKNDIKKGRVLLENGLYSWSQEYESAEATAIRDAKKLLELHGYVVHAPKDAK